MAFRRHATRVRVALGAALTVATLVGATGGAHAVTPAPWVIKVPLATESLPNWAFPFQTGATMTPSNVNYFQRLLYRPLYWFGSGPSIALNTDLSMATAPVYSADHKTVTINLKPGYKWSNGAAVQSNDVVMFLNLLASLPSQWGDYVPPLSDGTPLGIPDVIKSVSVISPSQLTLHLNRSVNATWFTMNELAQIIPMPQAWDVEPTGTNVANFPAGTTPLAAVSNAAGTVNTEPAGCWSSNWVGNDNNGVSDGSVAGQLHYGSDLNNVPTVVTDVGNNVTQARHCVYVRFLLRAAANDRGNYTRSGTMTANLWGVTDGPWRLKTYDASTGATVLIPSPTFAGTKSVAKELDYVPCGSDASCYALVANGTADVGQLPISLATPIRSLASAGKYQPYSLTTRGYTLTPNFSWSSNYLPMNFNSNTGANGHAGAVLAQRYVRQALAYATDQASLISRYFNGYATPTLSPIPSFPASPYTKVTTSAFPFSVARARALLTANGWKLTTSGPATCVNAGIGKGMCGSGIPVNTPLNFTMEYAKDVSGVAAQVLYLKSLWAQAGVVLTPIPLTYGNVVADVYGNTSGWDFADTGSTSQTWPTLFPTGEAQFASSALANAGGYANPATDALIKGMLYGATTFAQFESYLTQDVPVIWMPNALTLVETKKLKGAAPNALGTFTPELWRH